MNATIHSIGKYQFFVRLGYLSLLIILCASSVPAAPTGTLAYIDPSLQGAPGPSLSVIVRSNSMDNAARRVMQVGGEVTSDLWIIDSVGASIPRAQLMRLASAPGIHSIVANQGVRSADGPFDGWVTPRRIADEPRRLLDSLQSLPVALPDGGIVTVTEEHKLHILNADGSERQSVRLTKGDFPQSPIVGSDSSIYLSGDKSLTYRISSAGAVLWTHSHVRRITAVALDEANGLFYIGDGKGRITAINIHDGQDQWRALIGDGDVTDILVGTDGNRIIAVTDEGYIGTLNNTGRPSWVTRQADAAPFQHVVLAPHDGSLYVFGSNRWLYAIDNQGNVKFHLRSPSRFTAEPIVGADGLVVAGVADGMLYAVNADGTERFRQSVGDQPITGLALSPDETTVYALSNDRVVIALATHNGEPRWRYDTGEEKASSLVVEEDGLIHVVNRRGTYNILNDLGVAINRFELGDSVWPLPIFGADDRHSVYIAGKEKQIFVLARMPKNQDGQPDAMTTTTPGVYQLAYPVAVDVGADMLHKPHIPNQAPITGEGISIAVVDSGVEYSAEMRMVARAQLQARFLGQADFVEETCQEADGVHLGRQEADHCFQSADHSSDAYGHGSHVAGIIWSQYRDGVTDTFMGIAPGANLLSVRILDADGTGTYVDAIEGIQYVVANQDRFNIRVLNLSISAEAVTPYFVDPLNQAVERAWANGIVVLAAAGNEGPKAGSITVPGNDPYIITVGAIDSKRTPGYWMGDTLPDWSASGPTHDGFIKPDILAPGAQIVSTVPESATISQNHPANRVSEGLFRMSGTSMSTAVASGVVALMLQADPTLVPDQVKYRLAVSARPAVTAEGYPVHSILQQGMGRLWAPTAVFGDFPEDGYANQDMDIESDLAHGWISEDDRKYHYQGAVERLTSDDAQSYMFIVRDGAQAHGIGAVDISSGEWLTWENIGKDGSQPITIAAEPNISWAGGLALPSGMHTWVDGKATWAGGMATWAGGMATWAGGMATWAGGMATWAGGMATWAGGMATWAGGMATWAGGMATWAGGMATWAGGINTVESILASTTWVNDDGTTAEFQGNTVLNPVEENPESRPNPDQELGIQYLFLPIVEH